MPRITYLNFMATDEAIRVVNELRELTPYVGVVNDGEYQTLAILWTAE
jgi:hypothetical protein